MPKYEVKLTFKYSDTVHVEADNKEHAIALALEESNEQYESFYDASVTKSENDRQIHIDGKTWCRLHDGSLIGPEYQAPSLLIRFKIWREEKAMAGVNPASKLHRRINLAILCILVALIVGAMWWGMSA